MQDPENRMTAVPGAQSPDPAVSLTEEDVVDLEWLAPAVPVSDLLNNIGGYDGNFCYIYD